MDKPFSNGNENVLDSHLVRMNQLFGSSTKFGQTIEQDQMGFVEAEGLPPKDSDPVKKTDHTSTIGLAM